MEYISVLAKGFLITQHLIEKVALQGYSVNSFQHSNGLLDQKQFPATKNTLLFVKTWKALQWKQQASSSMFGTFPHMYLFWDPP